MEPPSFVSKAKIAFHSAAAKAERVFSELKPDRDSEKQVSNNSSNKSHGEAPGKEEPKNQHEVKNLRWRPPSIGTKQEWHDRFKNIRLGRKGAENAGNAENPKTPDVFYENVYPLKLNHTLEEKDAVMVSPVAGYGNAESIPSAFVLKQLAMALESGRKSNSISEFLVPFKDSFPITERTSLSLSAVKSLLLREKDDKFTSDIGENEKILTLIRSLFDKEGNFLRRSTGSAKSTTLTTSLTKEIHGAPPNSFIVKLSEVIGSFKSIRTMALFWFKVVAELRRLWFGGQHIPGIPIDEIPDLDSCILYQQLQVINCCISRKKRRSTAAESLDSVIREASSNLKDSSGPKIEGPAGSQIYAKLSTGELVLRLGADCLSENLTMLETGEPIYSPITQEGPVLTEDLIRETEEFIMRTGSVGAGCSQLLSDMQAFKAANPGCILEDFVRWHSPPDWTESRSEEVQAYDSGVFLCSKGQLSNRMQKEGNLWRELWDTAKPVPAVKQSPLYDEDLAVEGILNALEDLPPSKLFEQLFISLLGLGISIAEVTLSADGNLSKFFCECKGYIITSFQDGTWSEKIEDLCQVYKTVENMLLHPQELLKMTKEPEETSLKRQFKRLNINFGNKDRSSRMAASNEDNKGRPVHQTFASFLDSKSSLFGKKSPKPDAASPAEKPPATDESDWTIV